MLASLPVGVLLNISRFAVDLEYSVEVLERCSTRLRVVKAGRVHMAKSHWPKGLGYLCFVASIAVAAQAPPPARTVDVVDHIHGLTLPDPYRWMEGESSAEYHQWLKQQGVYARQRLDAAPQLAMWRDRLVKASSATVLNRLQRPMGGRLFFLRLEGGQEGVLMVRDPDGRERVLLAPGQLNDATGSASITEYTASPNGKRIAVNVDRGGSEITQVQLLDADSGALLPDVVEPVWGEMSVSWLPDGSAFAYTQMAPVDERPGGDGLQNMRVRLHRIGTKTTDDPTLLKVGLNPHAVFETQEFPFIDATAESDWVLAIFAGARAELRVCVVPRGDAFTASAPWNCFIGYEDGVQGWVVRDSTLYLLSVKGAPNGRVLAVDLSKAPLRLGDARVVLPSSPDAVVTGLTSASDALHVRRMTGGLDSILRIEYGTDKAEKIATPFEGAAYLLSTDPRAAGLVFTLQGWTQPRVAYRFKPGPAPITDLHLGVTTPGDYKDITSREVEAVSADGTRVPLSIISRKDFATDGHSLAILDGYGGYGTSLQPYFDALTLEWVKAGHVYAVAHVRGGGELGDAWRLGGRAERKYKGVEDFHACAKRLVEMKFTTPARLTASGASAGGLLIGGAITSAPELYGAAVIRAGMLNPVRLLAGANGANQIAEVGDPRTPEGLKAIAAMDPYQHVRDGVHYPAVLLVVGLNDQRVPPWESGKFGARLQAVSRGGRPVWFRTDSDTGHFGTSLSESAAEEADVYTFIESQLGQ